MSDTTYEPGIYQDVDHDIIKVDATGKTSIIGVGHDGFPVVDLSFATKIAELPRSERPAPTEPVLEDGANPDKVDGEVVLVEDGKVVEVLHTGDGCSTATHLGYYTSDNPDLSALVRLAAADTTDRLVPPLPADGFYSDRDGDVVQVKGDQSRYVSPFDLGPWEDAREPFTIYGPYTPLVEAASK